MSLFDVSDIQRGLDEMGGNLTWAQEEIAAAQRRHPAVADRGFNLLRPTHPLMRREVVYRPIVGNCSTSCPRRGHPARHRS